MDLPHVRRRERHRWRRIASDAARAEARAEREWLAHGQPVTEDLDCKITEAESRVAQLASDARFRHRWLAEYPDLARRIEHTQRELRRLDDPISVELVERVEAVAHEPPASSPGLDRADIAWLQARLDRLQHGRGIEPPDLSL